MVPRLTSRSCFVMPWRREREKKGRKGGGEEGKEGNMKREITSTNQVLYSSNINHT